MKSTQSSSNWRTLAKLSLALFGMVTLAPVGAAESPGGGAGPGDSPGGSSSGGFGGFFSGPSFGGFGSLYTILDESGDASFSRSYGEGSARGQMTLDASASVEVHSQFPIQPIPVGKAEADLNGRAQVKLFSSWREAAELNIHGQVESHDYTLNSSGTSFSDIDTVASADASISVQVAGITLYSDSWDVEEDYSTGPGFGGFGGSSSSSLSLEGDIELADNVWERDVLSASQTFWLGGFIPLRVSANAGGGLEVETGLTYSAFDHEVGVYGDATAYANGELSASIDYIIVAGGVTARADFASTTVSLDLGIDDDGLDGGMSISMTAIQVRLYAWARVAFWTYTKDVFGWSSGTRTYSRSL